MGLNQAFDRTASSAGPDGNVFSAAGQLNRYAIDYARDLLRNCQRQLVGRKSLSQTVRELVLMEAGYQCANPTCRHILTLDLHHIVWVRDGGTNDPDNLLALCPNCHSLHTSGHIPQRAIHTWKQLLVSLNSASRITADLLLVLYEEEQRVDRAEDASKVPPPFRFTGDGLPALAGLITAGLLAISKRYLGAGTFGASMPSFQVRLTDKGRRFVQAWLEGDPTRVNDVLSDTIA